MLLWWKEGGGQSLWNVEDSALFLPLLESSRINCCCGSNKGEDVVFVDVMVS